MQQVPEPLLTELGRVVAAWSHVENTFDMIYLGRIVMRDTGRVHRMDPIVKQMGQAFERRVGELRKYFKDHPDFSPMAKIAWDRALSQLISLRRKRDFLAHGMMGPAIGPDFNTVPDAMTIIFKSWRNQKETEFVTIKLAGLRKTFERMHRLFWDLQKLILSQDYNLPSRPTASR